MNANTLVAMTPGSTSGKRIFVSTCQVVAPSILAASSTSVWDRDEEPAHHPDRKR